VDDVVRAIFLEDSACYWAPGTPVEYEGSRCLALLEPWKLSGNQKALFRVGIVYLDFHSTNFFISGFALCFDIIVMPEQEGGCIVYTV
jgi:hypothetical protein